MSQATLGMHRNPHLPLDTLFGSISFAFWLVVYSPQIWENYKRKSGDGLSLIFVIVWLAGDIANLVGAAWQHLLPTIIVIACYYTICDFILLGQYYYYRRQRSLYPELYPALDTDTPSAVASRQSETRIRGDDESLSTSEDENERTSLLIGGHRPRPTEEEKPRRTWGAFAAWTIAFVGVITIVLVAVYLALGLGKVPEDGDEPEYPAPELPPGTGKGSEEWDTGAQFVGWISAFLYIGARIPQLIKNRETKCEGLSFLMFCFTVAGNVFYVLSILLPSDPEINYPQHILINLSWLAGSGLTVFLDFVVLGQFVSYRKDREAMKAAKLREASVYVP